ncbi:MAG TPA: tetratricopeptide repeat protein [Pyrinomonadaceae bacterium]
MTRDNLLFSIIGLLLGFICGFMFASTLSQRNQTAPATVAGGPNLPADHPPVAGDSGGGNPQQVFAQVQAAMKEAREQPKNFDAQVTAAKLEYQVQRYDQAIEFLLKANQLRPDSFDVLAMLGVANMDAGHYDVAEKWYRAALAKKPDDIVVLDGLCAVLLSKGDAKAAEAAIDKLAKLDPSNQDLAQFRDQLNSLKNPSK